MVDLVVFGSILLIVLAAMVPLCRDQADRSLKRMERHREEAPPITYVPSDLEDL